MGEFQNGLSEEFQKDLQIQKKLREKSWIKLLKKYWMEVLKKSKAVLKDPWRDRRRSSQINSVSSWRIPGRKSRRNAGRSSRNKFFGGFPKEVVRRILEEVLGGGPERIPRRFMEGVLETISKVVPERFPEKSSWKKKSSRSFWNISDGILNGILKGATVRIQKGVYE